MNTLSTFEAGQSLKSQIYEKILKRVLDHEYPMDELIAESKLMKEFNVSRAPVREALIELCRDNILRSIPKAGYEIVRISPKEIRDAFQMRLLIELKGLELAFNRLDGQTLHELREVARQTDVARHIGTEQGESLRDKMKLNVRFHLRISELSGNGLFRQTLEKTIGILSRGIAQIMIQENTMPFPDQTHHCRIVESLAEGKLGEARDSLEQDIKSLEKDFWDSLQGGSIGGEAK
jgi:DNA-binding GntR family transcriptional regulator